MWSARSRLFSTGKPPLMPPTNSRAGKSAMIILAGFALYKAFVDYKNGKEPGTLFGYGDITKKIKELEEEREKNSFNSFGIRNNLRKTYLDLLEKDKTSSTNKDQEENKEKNQESNIFTDDSSQNINLTTPNEQNLQSFPVKEEPTKIAPTFEISSVISPPETVTLPVEPVHKIVEVAVESPETPKPAVEENQVNKPVPSENPAPEHPASESKIIENAVTEHPAPEHPAAEPKVTENQVTEHQATELQAPELKAPEHPVQVVKVSESKVPEHQVTGNEKPSYSSSELDSMIQQIRSDLSQEQEKREKDLYSGIEDLFKTLISEYLPKADSSSSPARIISSNIDFSKMPADQIHRKFEELINAYQDRLETLGVRNYDSFIERLKLQKDKWRQKMLELQDSYEKQIEDEIKSRDEKWKKVLYEEAQDSESHYETQAKIDSDYVRQETELELSKKFKEELDFLTETLEKATKERLAQLEDIMKKIREMEVIQADHYEIIIKLTKIHKLHVSIENIQKALISDSGNLTEDLKIVIKEAKTSESIRKTLEKIEPVYSKVIISGIPKVKQIQERFDEQSSNARRAALIHSGNLLNVLMSRVAINFIPSNIRTVDDFDTLSLLKDAEEALAKGDLKKAKASLAGLKGLPAEEMKAVAEDIDLRLSFTELVENLSADSIRAVQKIVNAKALY
jgi:hypothetical protein